MDGESESYVPERLSFGSKTRQKLLEQLVQGTLTGEESAEKVQELHPLYQTQDKVRFKKAWIATVEYYKGSFRKFMNFILQTIVSEKRMSTSTAPGASDAILNRLNTKRTGCVRFHPTIVECSNKKRRENSPPPDNSGGRWSFSLSYDITVWADPTSLIKCLSLYVWLPTGSNEKTVGASVVDGGSVLEVSFIVPKPFLDSNVMHRRWLKTSTATSAEFHPKILAYKNLVAELREESGNFQASKSRIELAFSCNSHPMISTLAWVEEDVLVINVDLMKAESKTVEQKPL